MALGDRIAAVLAIDPAAGAIEFEDRWHSWAALGRIADGIDTAATAAGLGDGAPIGLLLENRPEMVGGVVGVARSQRCIVSLSPHQGAARLGEDLRAMRLPMIAASREGWAAGKLHEACVATGTAGLILGPGGVAPVPGLEERGPGPHREPLRGVAVEMLTSGTTGAPKRVELRAAALEKSLLGSKHYEAKREGTDAPSLRSGVAIISSPLVHIAGIFRTLQCICDGRPFALMQRFEIEAWLALVRRHRPKTVSLVPAALRSLLASEAAREDLASIKAVVSGTAPLAPEEALAFEERFGVPVLVTYGATEFAGGVAGWNLSEYRKYGAAKRGSVGRAHPGCELRVVEAESGRILEAGEVGLLEVKSSQVDGDAWVRTTDLAELDADGFLYIRGRADSAILRGGFKVLPSEVARVLERHPAVHEAVVVGLPDARLGARPVAAVELVALEDGVASPTEDELIEFAREHLSRYEVPSELRIVERLPRTPSLKVSQPEVKALFAEEAGD